MTGTASTPDEIMFVVNRLGYGPRAEEYNGLLKQGVNGWLEEQLSAPEGDDAVVSKHIQNCVLHIKYDAVQDKWPAVDEMRPLYSLSRPIDELWALFDPQKQINGQERGRPRLEVIAATMIRAVYSRYQLREIVSQFWHDHFHVNAFTDDHIAVALPVYDRDVIRKHSFGNFREMLEAVASSTAMQYYLSNHSSRAGSANENYARELFELHSFGRENYLNDHYDRWRDVPGAADGHPSGYIDQDVYEAARAFTGWTVEDGGQVDNGRKLPATGKFTYVENWHDGYQKRVLANDFDPFAPPMADGRKVLDLIAEHPATAEHMATKLCVRFLGPNPPTSLTSRVADKWKKTVHAPDQIAQLIRLIVLAPEFMQSRGSKVKRPLALMASYARIMGYDFTPSEGLFNQLSAAGQRLFGAPTPVGLPDDNGIFLGPNAMRNRWGLLLGLANNSWGNGIPDAARALQSWGGRAETGRISVAEWFRLFGVGGGEPLIDTVVVAAGLVPFAPVNGGDDIKHLAVAAAIAGMSPEFQVC
jgi:uncharacterized protein (DUF1800 family)